MHEGSKYDTLINYLTREIQEKCIVGNRQYNQRHMAPSQPERRKEYLFQMLHLK